MDYLVARTLLILQLTEEQLSLLHDLESRVNTRPLVGWEIAKIFDLPTIKPTNGWTLERKTRGPVTQTEQQRLWKYICSELDKLPLEEAHPIDCQYRYEDIGLYHDLDYIFRKQQFHWRDQEVKSKYTEINKTEILDYSTQD